MQADRTAASERVERLLPLKTLVFQILLVLHDGEKHGYSIVKRIRERHDGGRPVAPANLYRTLRTMLSQGLIAESEQRPDPDLDDERRRYFMLTDLGHDTVAAETARLERLLGAARRELAGNAVGHGR